MSTLATVDLPQMAPITRHRVALEFEPLTTQRLVVEVTDPAEGTARWVLLDYRSPGVTTLRVHTLTDADDDLRSPWDAVDAGRAVVIALGHIRDAADHDDPSAWLDDLEIPEPIGPDSDQERALVAAAVSGLAEIRAMSGIVAGAALVALQLQDLLANQLTGGTWKTVDDDDVIDGPQTLIEALAENDLLDGDAEDNRGIIEDAYRDRGYTDPEMSGISVRHSTTV
ncbi:hypothetical protein A5789_27790 [Nocardia sp. 852002-51101_SCH5132738]|uniref:hypothetical protein n=1 Tax=Nocardia sp. 852002-51101_SCH5132738 TaxID=1834095 RepID=UPI0007EAA7C7|nr:hypothetical protein [Nocardia sp. 852002-51101_SCH5132738]OBA51492.1 hypothetical protein A5789_27790 [Nocardia sp. 852002-51101_SCH5132738]